MVEGYTQTQLIWDRLIHENSKNYRGINPNDHSTNDLSIKLGNGHPFVYRQYFPKIFSLEYK